MKIGLSLCTRPSSYSTCFPKAEELLQDTEYQKCLKLVAPNRTIGKYRSMMDFLHCELFPFYKKACFDFYENDGDQLVDMVSESWLKRRDDLLCEALQVAHEARKQKVKLTWEDFAVHVEYNMLEHSLAA